ncbi:YDG/SRA domain-containing protein [Spirillospora sp. NPDC029432]|uniref:caspase, EACC1-associated type n=1 Tax=Spirillospora sp. NPDC029432 TaxID=3154599 RepID=UPI0034531A78
MLPDAWTSRAVLVGTSSYESLSQLPAVQRNLEEFSALLQDSFLCGLPPEHCTVVSNPTSAAEMLDPISEAAAEASDVLIVYFAGHGKLHSTGSDLYLALVGSDRKRMYRSVAFNHIRDELRESAAQRIIVILDCCYSGQALNQMDASDSTSRLADNAALQGTYLLASTAENRMSDAGHTYTVFSGQIFDLIKNGIPGEPSLLSMDAIYAAARQALEEQGMPSPQRREKGYGGDLAIFRNRARKGNGDTTFGEIARETRENWFTNRRALHDEGIHRPLQAGICGTATKGGAESIVVSGGYKDDRDYGDVILYTGHGGRDPDTGAQIRDQTLNDSGNAALLKSLLVDMPVRVVRGSAGNPKFSPDTGYSYDGLYAVRDYWTTPGVDGPQVLQFRLEKVNQNDADNESVHRGRDLAFGGLSKLPSGGYTDRQLVRELENIYDFACQVCGEILEVPGGLRFSSVFHIRALELPHRGPDSLDNMLCVCSNHRDLFAYGAIVITDDFILIDQSDDEEIGPLTRKHEINLEHVRYHRMHHKLSQWQRHGNAL